MARWPIMVAHHSGLAYVDRDTDAGDPPFSVDEVMGGYMDEGPECTTCEREIVGETHVAFDGGEVYDLECLEEEGLFDDSEILLADWEAATDAKEDRLIGYVVLED